MKLRYTLAIAAVLMASQTLHAGGSKKKYSPKKPDQQTIDELQTITLDYKITDKGLELNWSPANTSPSGGIKVTCSTTDDQPLYPFDGYVRWLSGTGHNKCTIPLNKLQKGKKLYLRLCSVHKKNHRRYVALSNVVELSNEVGKASSDSSKKNGKDYNKWKKTRKPHKTSDKTKSSVPEDDEPVTTSPVKTHAKAIIVDHNSIDASKIPVRYVRQARKQYRVWYGHTSHGSQITSGMQAMNRSPFTFSRNGRGGSLVYVETGGDLGHHGDLAWMHKTRKQLSRSDNKFNVVMWSWCGGCSDNTNEGIDKYLHAMAQLEKDYPKVTFVYMTGHVDGSGPRGKLHRNNERIRQFCRKYGKVLFDFADIESYDPSGKSFMSMRVRDNCTYVRSDGRRGNWATEWLARNPNHKYSLPSRAAHTHPLNGAMKGHAFWWMMARMAGWNGKTNSKNAEK